MSYFNKILASIGIGSAIVDTKLERSRVAQGEEIRGIVEIRGGNTEQKIDDIYLTINTQYLQESNDRKMNVTAVIERIRLAESFTISANERREIPFSFVLPLDTPVTLGRTRVWVATGLDIKHAVDPKDKDFLEVQPGKLLGAVLDAISSLGFRIREVECEKAPYRMKRRLPFIQEFEFVPISGSFRRKLDELELVFQPKSSQEADLYFQIDRKPQGLGGLLAEALEMDESNIRMSVSLEDIPLLKQKLQAMIQQYC